ncbi:acyltransferase family protein [Massilia sp. IC2-477]|uniref:acyltransferase family protein n=1 Tax=Massilia sp. IC2-477 TaxID=2887198 RepID=UPI001D0FA758|nr:acyltransferase family protein [Massilia sp. IC2-477]MCC2957643.1 acyltransferase family protein [Massilia sp. IC2-477]
MSTERPSSYVVGLDLVRFACTLMVCVFHLSWHKAEMVTAMPFGWIGVQVFFVISGVVIANSAARASPLQFLKSRFLRLYPAAWLAAVVNFGLLLSVPLTVFGAAGVWVDPTSRALWYSLVLGGTTFLTSAYWTLPIELAFYGLILLAIFGGGVRRFLPVARLLVLASVPYCILLSRSLVADFELGWFEFGYGPKNMFLLRHGIYFAIGMYFWLLNSQRRLALLDRVLLALALLGAGLEIFARAMQIVGSYAPGPAGPMSVGFLVSGALAIFAVLAAIIYLSLRHARDWVPGPAVARTVRSLGLLTYPFYLIHEILGATVLHAAQQRGLGPAGALLAALPVIGATAWLIAMHGEPLLRRAIERLLGWQGRTAGATLPR